MRVYEEFQMHEDIKRVIIGVRDLYTRKNISLYPFEMTPKEFEWFQKEAEIEVKAQLAEKIKDYIKINWINPVEVEAAIYMPYVKDEVIEEFEKKLNNLDKLLGEVKYELGATNAELEFFHKPWWKRLFKKYNPWC